MDEKRINLLANESVSKAILKLSIPMIMGMMFQVFYNLVDTYFIGMLGDANQLAAANLALPIFTLTMGIASIIGTGASSYISRCLGKNDYKEASKTTTIAVVLLLCISLVVSIFGIIFIKPLVSILGASKETYTYTYDYIIIMLIGSVGVMGNFALGQLLRAEGNVMKSTMGLIIGTILNIVLDPIFIFTFDLGVGGAALATIIGNYVGCLYYVYCFVKGDTSLKINFKLFNFDKNILIEIFKIGLPSSLSQVLVGFATIVANNIAVMYGTLTVAGMGVAMKIMMIGTFIFIGFSTGCQPIIGYSYGAGNISRVKDTIKEGIKLTFMVGVVLFILFTFTSPVLIGLFTNDIKVVENGQMILKALSLSLPFMGGTMIATSATQSMGKAIPALILSVSRQGLLYIPLLIILNKVAGFNGFIYSQPITDVLMIVFSSSYLFAILKKEEVKLDMSIAIEKKKK